MDDLGEEADRFVEFFRCVPGTRHAVPEECTDQLAVASRFGLAFTAAGRHLHVHDLRMLRAEPEFPPRARLELPAAAASLMLAANDELLVVRSVPDVVGGPSVLVLDVAAAAKGTLAKCPFPEFAEDRCVALDVAETPGGPSRIALLLESQKVVLYAMDDKSGAEDPSVQPLRVAVQAPVCLALATDASVVAVGTMRGSVCFYDVQTGKLLGTIVEVESGWVPNFVSFLAPDALHVCYHLEGDVRHVVWHVQACAAVGHSTLGKVCFPSLDESGSSDDGVEPKPHVPRIMCAVVPSWDICVMASSASTDLQVVAREDGSWTIWTCDEGKSATLPTDEEDRDTLPLGIALDLTDIAPVASIDPNEAPRNPMPRLLVLTSEGILTSFSLVDDRDGASCKLIAEPSLLPSVRSTPLTSLTQPLPLASGQPVSTPKTGSVEVVNPSSAASFSSARQTVKRSFGAPLSQANGSSGFGLNGFGAVLPPDLPPLSAQTPSIGRATVVSPDARAETPPSASVPFTSATTARLATVVDTPPKRQFTGTEKFLNNFHFDEPQTASAEASFVASSAEARRRARSAGFAPRQEVQDEEENDSSEIQSSGYDQAEDSGDFEVGDEEDEDLEAEFENVCVQPDLAASRQTAAASRPEDLLMSIVAEMSAELDTLQSAQVVTLRHAENAEPRIAASIDETRVKLRDMLESMRKRFRETDRARTDIGTSLNDVLGASREYEEVSLMMRVAETEGLSDGLSADARGVDDKLAAKESEIVRSMAAIEDKFDALNKRDSRHGIPSRGRTHAEVTQQIYSSLSLQGIRIRRVTALLNAISEQLISQISGSRRGSDLGLSLARLERLTLSPVPSHPADKIRDPLAALSKEAIFPESKANGNAGASSSSFSRVEDDMDSVETLSPHARRVLRNLAMRNGRDRISVCAGASLAVSGNTVSSHQQPPQAAVGSKLTAAVGQVGVSLPPLAQEASRSGSSTLPTFTAPNQISNLTRPRLHVGDKQGLGSRSSTFAGVFSSSSGLSKSSVSELGTESVRVHQPKQPSPSQLFSAGFGDFTATTSVARAADTASDGHVVGIPSDDGPETDAARIGHARLAKAKTDERNINASPSASSSQASSKVSLRGRASGDVSASLGQAGQTGPAMPRAVSSDEIGVGNMSTSVAQIAAGEEAEPSAAIASAGRSTLARVSPKVTRNLQSDYSTDEAKSSSESHQSLDLTSGTRGTPLAAAIEELPKRPAQKGFTFAPLPLSDSAPDFSSTEILSASLPPSGSERDIPKAVSAFASIPRSGLERDTRKSVSSFASLPPSGSERDTPKTASSFASLPPSGSEQDRPKAASSFASLPPSGSEQERPKAASSFASLPPSGSERDTPIAVSSFASLPPSGSERDTPKAASSFASLPPSGSKRDTPKAESSFASLPPSGSERDTPKAVSAFASLPPSGSERDTPKAASPFASLPPSGSERNTPKAASPFASLPPSGSERDTIAEETNKANTQSSPGLSSTEKKLDFGFSPSLFGSSGAMAGSNDPGVARSAVDEQRIATGSAQTPSESSGMFGAYGSQSPTFGSENSGAGSGMSSAFTTSKPTSVFGTAATQSETSVGQSGTDWTFGGSEGSLFGASSNTPAVTKTATSPFDFNASSAALSQGQPNAPQSFGFGNSSPLGVGGETPVNAMFSNSSPAASAGGTMFGASPASAVNAVQVPTFGQSISTGPAAAFGAPSSFGVAGFNSRGSAPFGTGIPAPKFGETGTGLSGFGAAAGGPPAAVFGGPSPVGGGFGGANVMMNAAQAPLFPSVPAGQGGFGAFGNNRSTPAFGGSPAGVSGFASIASSTPGPFGIGSGSSTSAASPFGDHANAGGFGSSDPAPLPFTSASFSERRG